MNKNFLTIIVIFLFPISVFGSDWTVSYDMKKSDGSIEFIEMSVPISVIKGFWTLPHQVGSWECSLSGNKNTMGEHLYSSMSLNCRSREDKNIHLTSVIGCNTRSRKNNELGVVYPKTIKNDESIPIRRTIVTLKCNL